MKCLAFHDMLCSCSWPRATQYAPLKQLVLSFWTIVPSQGFIRMDMSEFQEKHEVRCFCTLLVQCIKIRDSIFTGRFCPKTCMGSLKKIHQIAFFFARDSGSGQLLQDDFILSSFAHICLYERSRLFSLYNTACIGLPFLDSEADELSHIHGLGFCKN